MHDDPTRMMGRPEDPDHHPHGNMRLVVAGLIAVIVGLVIAIFVIAGDDGGSDTTATSASETTTLPTETTETTTNATTETTPTTTETTPTETTETTPTTTEASPPTTAPEEGGSGGIEAP